MPGKIPRRPSGSSSSAEFAKWQYDNEVRESGIQIVSGHRTANTTGGKLLIPSTSRGRSRSVSVALFKLRFAEDDYLVCREWDGTTLGTSDIYVAKPALLKCSTASRQGWATGPAFADQTYTYAADSSEPYMEFGDVDPELDPLNEWGEATTDYDSGGDLYQKRLNKVRTVTQDGIQENQRVIPVWIKGEIIYGIEFDDGGTTAVGSVAPAGQSIDYLMIADSRMWARI